MALRGTSGRARRRRVPLALLVVSALLATAGVALAAAGGSTGAPAAAKAGTLKLGASPGSVSVAPGETATLTVKVTAKNLASPVALSVTGLPAGTSATFNPGSSSGGADVTLSVTTDAVATPDGKYTLSIQGSADGVSDTTTATLAVSTPTNFPFAVSGSVSGLAPGTTAPIDLGLSNRSSTDLQVTSLTVAIGSITAPNASAARPCTAADFQVGQYSGSFPLALPARSSRSLSGLGVPAARRPTVTMLNRPVNQDGCKGATLTFTYGGGAHS